MHPAPRFTKAVAFLALFGLVTKASSAIIDKRALAHLSRIPTFDDVARTFTSEFKSDPVCPDKIEIRTKPRLPDAGIRELNFTDIEEDGHKCRGLNSTVLKLVPKEKAKSDNFLAEMGYSKAQLALNKSVAANFMKKNKNDSNEFYLIGFSEGRRTCGMHYYSQDALWFYSNTSNWYRFNIGGKEKDIRIPPNISSLFISEGTWKVCVLTEKSTSADKEVKVAKTSPSPSVYSSAKPKVTPTADKTKKHTTAVQFPTATEDAQNLEASPAPSSNAGNSECFPAHARVELEDGSSVTISTIRIGDRVRTGNESFSDVFMFSHRDMNVAAEFVHLSTSSGHHLLLTPFHYLYGNGKLAAAGTVKVGDEVMLGNGSFSKVVSTQIDISKGLYNPHTLDGNIVVDGVITSTYTTSVHPMVAHAGLLAPLRLVYHVVGTLNILDKIGTFVGSNAAHLSCVVPGGPMSSM